MKSCPVNYILFFLACLCLLILLFFQPHAPNFSPGHYGWISAHVLAIIRRATPENFLLGYTCLFDDSYKYFDRFPVFFSAFANGFLEIFANDEFKKQISTARALMNTIYFFTGVVSYYLVKEYVAKPFIALAITLFVFSGYYFIYFKDMMNYSAPALLGLMAFLYLLKVSERKPQWRRFLPLASVIAASMGEGYATNFVVLFWFLTESVLYLCDEKFNVLKAAKKSLKSTAFVCLIVSGFVSVFSLSYNIYTEAQIRDVPISETSIVDSATRRLGANENFNTGHEQTLAWGPFFLSQAQRFAKGFIPYSLSRGENHKLLLIWLILLSSVIFFAFYKNRDQLIAFFFNKTNFIIWCSGIFWLFPMKRLAAFHHYTNMYYLGAYLLLCIFVFQALRPFLTKRREVVVLAISFVAFLSSNILNFKDQKMVQEKLPDITQKLQILVDQVPEGEKYKFYFESGYRKLIVGAPYASCFYLQDHIITESKEKADIIIEEL